MCHIVNLLPGVAGDRHVGHDEVACLGRRDSEVPEGCALLAGSVAEPLLDVLLAKTKKLRVGDGSKDGTEMGPLVTEQHREKVAGYIAKGVAEGATPLCDGRAGYEGYFLGPTIFDHVTPDMTIAREEIFGPVLSVIRVADLDEAIAMSDRVVCLSAGPASHPIGEFAIDLPRPRDVAEVRATPRFVELHQAIWSVLREEVLAGYRQQLAA